MKKLFLLNIIFVLVIVACSPKLITQTLTATSLPPTCTKAPTLNKTVESTLTRTSDITSPSPSPQIPDVTITPSGSQSSEISPPFIEKLCPQGRKVPFNELEISDSTRLMLRDEDIHLDENEVYIWTLSITQTQPVTVPNIVPGARIVAPFQIIPSPDLNKFIYWGQAHKNDKEQYLYDFWINSIDGKQQWKLASDIPAGINPKWISDDRIEFWKASRLAIECPTLEFTIDPFTLQIQEAPIFPELDGIYCAYPGWILSPDRTKALYPKNGNTSTTQWVINDLSSGQTAPVFPWLKDIELFYPYFGINIRWTNKGFDFVFLQDFGFDFLLDLPVSAIDDSAVPLERFSLPREVMNNQLNWWSADGRYFSFDMVDENVDQNEFALRGEVAPSHFYLFDTKTKVLRDYCLDRGDFGELKGDAWMPVVSKDGRFMAWGIYEQPNEQRYPYGIIILDLETGRYAELSLGTLDLLGWGEAPSKNTP